MKQFVIVISLFSLIISSSQAQRGWRLFNQFGWVLQIHQSANHSLWVASFNGVWRLHDGTWQQVPHASTFVFEDSAGAIWSAGPNSEGLWRYDTPMVGNSRPRLLASLIQPIRNRMAPSGSEG